MVTSLVRLIPLLMLILVAGCASRAPVPEVVPVALPEGSPAIGLLEDAREARSRGDTGGAGRYLERALMLAPGQPILYRELADLRLEEGDPVAAEGLALRALHRAPDNPDWQAGVWEMIALARRRQGDQAGAQLARDRAAALLGGRD